MTKIQIWLWLKLDAMSGLGSLLSALLAVMAVVLFVVPFIGLDCSYQEEDKDKWKRRIGLWGKHAIWAAIGAFVLLTFAKMMPNTKEMATIIVVPKILESKAFTNDIPDLYNMGIDLLKTKIIDAKQTIEKEKQ